MSTDAPAILPDTFFYSVFRNLTDAPLFVPWAGGHGINVAPKEHFKILGDPRVLTPQVLGSQMTAQCVMDMIRAGVVEFCSSPGQVFDNFVPDGASMALYSKDGNPVLEQVPLDKEELAMRFLPMVTPLVTFDDLENKVTVDWLGELDLDIHDKFVIDVIQPTGKTTRIKCGSDRKASFTPKNGVGTYKVTVTLIAVDGREQAGMTVDVVVTEPVTP